MKAVSYLAAERKDMQKGRLVLSLFLWLGERPACYGSTDIPTETESSGDGMPLSTATMGSSATPTLTNTEDVLTATMQIGTADPEMGDTAITDGNETGTADLHPALIFGVPAALLIILLILLVFLIVRCRKKKQSKQDELGSENCKSPIFEEDTPSVMEIEMEELDKWMNSLKRNADCEYLPPVKEEKDCNANPSDCES